MVLTYTYTVGTAGPVEVTIIDNDTLALENVEFTGNLDLISDMDHETDAKRKFGVSWKTGLHWVKGNIDKTLPVAYSCGDEEYRLKANAEFSGTIEGDPTIEARFIANGFPNGAFYSGWVEVGVDFLTLSALMASNATALKTFREIYCVQQPDFIGQMELEWEMRIDGDDDDIRSIGGSSLNPLYITREDPIAGPLYHTVVHVGCVAAKEQSTETAVFDAIWAEFSGASIAIFSKKIQNGVVSDNNALYYYGIAVKDAQGNMVTNPVAIYPESKYKSLALSEGIDATDELLRRKDGQCRAWALFMGDILAVQGISSSIVSVATTQANGTIKYTDPATGIKYDLTPANLRGIFMFDDSLGKHHGVAPMSRVFGLHFVLLYGDSYYDPSNGIKSTETTNKSKEEALAQSIWKYGFYYHQFFPLGVTGYSYFFIDTALGSQAIEDWIDAEIE